MISGFTQRILFPQHSVLAVAAAGTQQNVLAIWAGHAEGPENLVPSQCLCFTKGCSAKIRKLPVV